MSGRQQRVMVQPIVCPISFVLKAFYISYLCSKQNVIFKHLQQVGYCLFSLDSTLTDFVGTENQGCDMAL
jgi:hypothetical protein